MTTTRRRALAGACAAVLLTMGVAACSDDGGDDATSDETTTTAAEPTTDAPEGTEAPDDSTAPATEVEGDAGAAGAAVAMAGIAYDPPTLEVAAGTEVTWTNEDSATHTVTADDGAFDSGDVEQDGTFSQTFDEAGTYGYVCTIHASMSGEVVVG